MTTQAPGHDPLIGRELDHYRILQQIGAGGMGEVYRAHDEHLDREVAIKVLHSGDKISADLVVSESKGPLEKITLIEYAKSPTAPSPQQTKIP